MTVHPTKEERIAKERREFEDMQKLMKYKEILEYERRRLQEREAQDRWERERRQPKYDPWDDPRSIRRRPPSLRDEMEERFDPRTF